MSRQQLFINDVAVDMPQDEIKIKVESNILSDADKVKTAHSYNIALPRTATNDRVMLLAYLPSAETGGTSTHTYLNASLYVDGVPLFNAGRAVLTSVDDKGYNINLFWGVVNAFEKIKSEGLKMCELPLSQWWDDNYDRWTKLAKYNDIYDSSNTNYYDSGMDARRQGTLDDDSIDAMLPLPFALPVVWSLEMLGAVQNVYGFLIDASEEFYARMYKLYFPLTSRKQLAKDESLYISLRATQKMYNNRYWLTWLPVRTSVSVDNLTNVIGLKTVPAGNSWLLNTDKAHIKSLRISGRCSGEWSTVWGYESNPQEHIAVQQEDGTWTLDYTWRDVELEREQTFPVLTNRNSSGVSPAYSLADVTMFIEISELSDAVIGDMYSTVRNYPDIKVIDFLSEILAHTGSFIVGSVAGSDKVKISTYDEALVATPQNKQLLGLNEIEMSVDDLAKRNNYVHQDNDDDTELDPYDASGVLYTHDSTLKLERDAFKSHFKVPRNNIVKLFNYEKNDNSNNYRASWAASGDYIIGVDQSATPWRWRNTGYQSFADVLSEYYSGFGKMIERPKTIKLTMRLTMLQLLSLKMDAPVYIEQLGRSYLIVSIESDHDDNYKLTLIQL